MDNLFKIIYIYIDKNVYPILRLVCKKWYKILDKLNYRCKLISLVEYASRDLLEYLIKYDLTDFTNFKYLISICKSKDEWPILHSKLQYIKKFGAPLTKFCYNSASNNFNIELFNWLYENKISLPSKLSINKINLDFIGKIESKYDIKYLINLKHEYNVKYDFNQTDKNSLGAASLAFSHGITHIMYDFDTGNTNNVISFIDDHILKHGINKLSKIYYFLVRLVKYHHFNLYNLIIQKYNIIPSKSLIKMLWNIGIKNEDSKILILLYTNKYKFYLPEYKIFKRIKNIRKFIKWIINRKYFNKNKTKIWLYLISKQNTEICQYVWDKNLYFDETNNKDNYYIYMSCITSLSPGKYSYYKKFIKMFNWCLERKFILLDVDYLNLIVSHIFKFCDMRLFEWLESLQIKIDDNFTWTFKNNYIVNDITYNNIIRYGSTNILDKVCIYKSDDKKWVERDLIRNIIISGSVNMLNWYINKCCSENKNIDSIDVICNIISGDALFLWNKYPNHKIFERIYSDITVNFNLSLLSQKSRHDILSLFN